jgi:hypothetical protein
MTRGFAIEANVFQVWKSTSPAPPRRKEPIRFETNIPGLAPRRVDNVQGKLNSNVSSNIFGRYPSAQRTVLHLELYCGIISPPMIPRLRTTSNPLNMDKAPTAKSPLEVLPVEARQATMLALSDVESLRYLALSCSSFYDAFKTRNLWSRVACF